MTRQSLLKLFLSCQHTSRYARYPHAHPPTRTSRPDIAFVINQLSRYCNNFGSEHWQAAKHCIAYIKGTASHGLCYGGVGANVSSALISYSESDYARDLY